MTEQTYQDRLQWSAFFSDGKIPLPAKKDGGR